MLRYLSLRLLGCLLGAALMLSGCTGGTTAQPGGRGKRGQGGAGQPVSVAVAKAEHQNVPVYLNALGAVQAFNTVVVRSRIDGQLVQVAFKEGQEVKQGDLLAVIDPRPYQVQLSQAEAALYKDQSALKDAQLNLQRFQDLFKNGGVISQQQVDTQSALVGQLDGQVRSDQAQIDNVKLQLTYTRITAPVSGRVGLRQVDLGNIVHASDPNGLLVLTQLQPIAVIFTLPEDSLPSVSSHMRGAPLQVEAYSRDNQTLLATGTLLTIDNQIDPSTGTGKLKAVFQNHERALWPNQFVNVKLLLETLRQATVVPAAAVQKGPQGNYIFVMKDDKTVDMRYVSVSLTQDTIAVVTQNLKPGEVVVTDGQDKLQAGSKVEPRGMNGGQAPKEAQRQGVNPGRHSKQAPVEQ